MSKLPSTAFPAASPRAEVEARLTSRTIDVFHKGERIAAHERMSGNRKHTTVPDHMPSSHQRYAGWMIASGRMPPRAGDRQPHLGVRVEHQIATRSASSRGGGEVGGVFALGGVARLP